MTKASVSRYGGNRVNPIGYQSRKMEEVMKVRLMMEDLMEDEGWMKYLINCSLWVM